MWHPKFKVLGGEKGWKWSRLISAIWAAWHKTTKFYNPQFHSFFTKPMCRDILDSVLFLSFKRRNMMPLDSFQPSIWNGVCFEMLKKKWVQYKLGIKIICFLKMAPFPQHDVTWLYSIVCDRISYNDAVKLRRVMFHLRMEVSNKQSCLLLLE